MNRPLILGVILISTMGLGIAGSAAAETFAISNQIRNFCCTDWTDRTATPTPAPNPGGGAFGIIGGFANQPGTVGRTVSQTLVSPPFDVAIPQSRLGAHFTLSSFMHPNALLDTLTILVSLDNPAGVMEEGGGPGSFEFCPDGVGPGPGACAAPAFATGGPNSLAFHGRVAVEQLNPNRFGGVMGWLGAGLVGTVWQHNSAYTQWTKNEFNVLFSKIGNVTTPQNLLARGTQQSIIDSFWPSSAMAVTPVMDTGHSGVTGHAWTTGRIQVSITQVGVPPFQAVTITGSDTRETTGPDIGTGNLSLVSAGLYQDFVTGRATPRANAIDMALPEPVTGFAVAAGALGFVLAGLSRRRR